MHVVIGGNGDDVDPGGDLSAVLETIPIRSSRNWRRDSWNSQVIDGDEPL